MEVIELEKLPGLKRGKKWKVSEEQESVIHEGLVEWREDELLDKIRRRLYWEMMWLTSWRVVVNV